MKRKINRLFCLVLTLVFCFSLCTPVYASNSVGVFYNVELNQGKVSVSAEEQTVVMTITANKTFSIDAMGMTILIPEGWAIASIKNGPLGFTSNNINLKNGKVNYATADAENAQTNFVVDVTYRIPSNCAAGTYKLGIENLVISKDYGTKWEDESAVTTVFRVEGIEATEPESKEPEILPGEPDEYEVPDMPIYDKPQWTNCSTAWAEPYLWDAVKKEIFPEILQQTDMTLAISREEFASVAVKYYEALTGRRARLDKTIPNPFTDVTEQQEDILIANQLGVVKGMTATTFEPNGTLTRAQAVTMLGRVVELVETGAIDDGSALKIGGVLKIFSDSNQISNWAAYYVNYFVSHGVIDGMGDGTFMPNGNMTREQAMKVAVVALDK